MNKNSMIIKDSFGNCEHFVCQCSNCECKNPDEPIPIFYSFVHAIDNGWILTKDKKYCPPEKDSIFVCPECYDK